MDRSARGPDRGSGRSRAYVLTCVYTHIDHLLFGFARFRIVASRSNVTRDLFIRPLGSRTKRTAACWLGPFGRRVVELTAQTGRRFLRRSFPNQ